MNKSKLKTIFFLLLVIPAITFTACEIDDIASNWDAVYDHDTTVSTYDSLYRLAVDSDGNAIMIGSSIDLNSGSENEKLVVVKYNTNGTMVWDFIHEFSYNRGIYISDYFVDADDSIYVSGVTNYDNASFLIKLSSSGEMMWEKIIEREGWLTGAITVLNGSVYWAHMDLTIVNASTGSINCTVPVNRKITDMAADSAGNIYVAGYDFYASYNAAGSLRWTKTWGTDLQTVSLAMSDSDVLYAAAGVAGAGSAIAVFRIDKTGNIITRIDEAVPAFWIPYISLDRSGNVIVATSLENSYTRTVIKYSSSLSKKWRKNFEGSRNNGDMDQLITDKSDNIYVTGGDLTMKISSGGSKIASEKDSSYFCGNRIALSPDNSMFYIATYSDDGEVTLLLSQYTNK